MKTKLLLLLSLWFCLVSCRTSEKGSNNDSGFKASLMEFANSEINFYSATRSGGEVLLSGDELNRIIELAAEIMEEYNLRDVIANSGLYTEEMAEDFVEMDFYEIMSFFEENSTAEFYDLVCDMLVYDNPISHDKIINSLTLLPNEQFALIAASNVKNGIAGGIHTTSAADCLAAKEAGLADCRERLVIKVVFSVAVGCVVPWLGLILGGATTIDNDTCVTSVGRAYDECMASLAG